jgi:beta-1,2-mannobiose phosphorylase / 1,2-beta-oligomannan phosphorylase
MNVLWSDKFSRAGWMKYRGGPVLGGELGTCFDLCVLPEEGLFRMYFSWRPKQALALSESPDGIHWSDPLIVLDPRPTPEGWEDDLNRPCVLKRDGIYQMWYTGQSKPGQDDGSSWIFYATSQDGKAWERASDQPVFSPKEAWEKNAVMCPHVLWDEPSQEYRMWYSGGEQYEPDSIGYACSPDGLYWTRGAQNPVFFSDPLNAWEAYKVAACQVIRQEDGYLMFYVGFRDLNFAQIGLARSRDGRSEWQRHPANPILFPGPGQWDGDACYKPYALALEGRWLLWYNGRSGHFEQIGLAAHAGLDLGFPAYPTQAAGPLKPFKTSRGDLLRDSDDSEA